MKILKQEVTSKKGNPYFVYKYSNGKFASKELFEQQENMNNKRRRSKKVPKIEEGTQVVNLGSDFDVDKEWTGTSGVLNEDGKVLSIENILEIETQDFKEQVIEFEQSIEKAFQEPKVTTPIVEDTKVDKTPGFFKTWFKKYIW